MKSPSQVFVTEYALDKPLLRQTEHKVLSCDASLKVLALLCREKAWIIERKITRKESVKSARDKKPEKPHPPGCAGRSSQSAGTPLCEGRPLVLALRSSGGRLTAKLGPKIPGRWCPHPA